MNRLQRFFRHLLTTAAAGRRRFPSESLKAIHAAITEGERQHRAEVRVAIEAALPLSAVLEGMPARGRAHELFSLHRIWDTEENCGVLVYVNLADHKVEIVADRGVGRALRAAEWQDVCRTMTEGYARGAYGEATIAGLHRLNTLLAERLPADGARDNQLPDRPIVL